MSFQHTDGTENRQGMKFTTRHAFLVLTGFVATALGLRQVLESCLKVKQKVYQHSPILNVLQALVGILGGCRFMKDLNQAASPVSKDRSLAKAWGQKERKGRKGTGSFLVSGATRMELGSTHRFCPASRMGQHSNPPDYHQGPGRHKDLLWSGRESRWRLGWRKVSGSHRKRAKGRTGDQQGGTEVMECHCAIREPGGFRNWYEINTLEKALEDGTVWDEVAVSQPYCGGVGFSERWFRCKHCGKVWRLVYPDGPFSGVWELVS